MVISCQLTFYVLDVRTAFPAGLARIYLGFIFSFDYSFMVLIPLKVTAKASRKSGILNTL